jgi:hypothetical protein
LPLDLSLQESQGLAQDLLSARESLLQRGVKPGTIALQCGLASLTFGFLFQITHNVGFLPVRNLAYRACEHRRKYVLCAVALQHIPSLRDADTDATHCWASLAFLGAAVAAAGCRDAVLNSM